MTRKINLILHSEAYVNIYLSYDEPYFYCLRSAIIPIFYRKCNNELRECNNESRECNNESRTKNLLPSEIFLLRSVQFLIKIPSIEKLPPSLVKCIFRFNVTPVSGEMSNVHLNFFCLIFR